MQVAPAILKMASNFVIPYKSLINGIEVDNRDLTDLFSLKGRAICLALSAAYLVAAPVSLALMLMIAVISPFAIGISTLHSIVEDSRSNSRSGQMARHIGEGVIAQFQVIGCIFGIPVLQALTGIKCAGAALVSPGIHLVNDGKK
jgi:hypothetical protein